MGKVCTFPSASLLPYELLQHSDLRAGGDLEISSNRLLNKDLIKAGMSPVSLGKGCLGKQRSFEHSGEFREETWKKPVVLARVTFLFLL